MTNDNNKCRIARTKLCTVFLSSCPPTAILEFRSLSLAYAWPMRRDVDPKRVFENQANLMDMFCCSFQRERISIYRRYGEIDRYVFI